VNIVCRLVIIGVVAARFVWSRMVMTCVMVAIRSGGKCITTVAVMAGRKILLGVERMMLILGEVNSIVNSSDSE